MADQAPVGAGQRPRWIEPRISVGNILTLLLVAASAFWFFAQQDTKIALIEQRLTTMETAFAGYVEEAGGEKAEIRANVGSIRADGARLDMRQDAFETALEREVAGLRRDITDIKQSLQILLRQRRAEAGAPPQAR